ncbi:CpaF family protein [Acidithiobacillus ferrooxidans]|uniref:ATPase, T2SS/T4P/T4SS family n=1 Tax=Acidithiobacillus ferrooxidans TaxID=920 RepID=UPI000A7D8A72|nr:ATPase, T2SS/T4P/T4SS family [Acidithiobacillus ferrooxidans]MBU2858272.1 CpaF family protein [Acidithiobacillus ferrooxidans]MBU2861070.1 CpaF family protein [Acidithiobacillus ferrooxidans]MCL4527614.1 CpaF family protein [Gammaproteobacteria bacterium]MCR2829662.1 CpaF family protein [Acidithiobacillus ferrooxidans]
MFTVRVSHPKIGTQVISPSDGVCLLGKAEHAHLRMEGWNVGKEHARIYAEQGGVYIEGLGGFGAVLVNGERMRAYGPVEAHDEIFVAGYRLQIMPRFDNVTASAEESGHLSLSGTKPPGGAPAINKQSPYWNQSLTEEVNWPTRPVYDAHWLVLVREVHEAVRSQMDLRRVDLSALSPEELRRIVGELVREVVWRMNSPPEFDRQRLVKEVLDEAVGLGPLEDFLADESITEIMVNRYDEVFIERQGRLLAAPALFSSEMAVRHIIDRIVAPIGRRIDESAPLVDARLPDGSRVNAVIPPLSLKGACITIRKFSKKRLQMEDLIAYDSIAAHMAHFLQICVQQRKNIIISGGTGSGKTTLLNVLSNYIPDHERIVTIEDAAELRLYQPNLVSLEARPANMEGKGRISIRELVRNALRMRPDRIVVGECRGGEALDMLQAMNTGHDGSLTTAHANTARDMLSRLEVMVLMAGMDIPLIAIREQIASAVDIIVQITRFSCGSRKVTSVCEVTGIESGTLQLQELFAYKQQGYDAEGKVRGVFRATGAVPEFYEAMRERGLPVDLSIFRTEDTLRGREEIHHEV